MEKTQFTGIFDVDLYECKGKLYFNELNVRLGANGFALIYGVANVPGIFVKEMLGIHDDVSIIPKDFIDKSFASEKVLRDMYNDNTISYKRFKSYLKEADILSLKFKDDNGPYEAFCKINSFLPLRNFIRSLKIWTKKVYPRFMLIMNSIVKSLCINDTPICTDEEFSQYKELLQDAFRKKFPEKSSFEI